MDPIAAFHRLEDLVDRKNVEGEPAEVVRSLRTRLPNLRNGSSSDWVDFYREALYATRMLSDRPAGPEPLSAAERRYIEALLNDVRDAPSGVADLWSRRLSDQRDELVSKAREEAARLKLVNEMPGDRLRVRVNSGDRHQWADWLEHYLRLWTDRVVNEVPAGIQAAQRDALARSPASLAPHVPPPPAVPAEPFSAAVDSDWSGLSADGTVPGAWALFGKSIRGGIFAVMMVATITGSIAAAFQSGGQSPARALIVLLLLIPVIIWARVSSDNQRRTAVDELQIKLEEQVRQRLLQLTQSRIDARLRSLRGWLQRAVRAARTEAQSWVRESQLRLAESGDRLNENRVAAAAAEITSAFETRIVELERASAVGR